MRHYVATTYIIDKQEKEILLHYHHKLKSWLPPGGHVEEDESPIETAMREITEETLITEVEFISNNNIKISKIKDSRVILRELPHFLLEEKIEENHYHLDWIFFAFYDKSKFRIPDNDIKFRWYTIEELNRESNIFENVKRLGIYGIQEFCK